MEIRTNLHYLQYSIDNKENLDLRYMSLNLHDSLDQMVETTKEIKEILITIKRLKMNNLPADEFYNELLPLVMSEQGSKNEFNSFINACDSAISTIKSNPETFKDIVDLYLEHRSISEYTPKEWIQALIDKGSQRRIGVIGENKVIEFAEKAGFKYTENPEEFLQSKFSVCKYNKSLKNRINSKINFGSQDKDLDIVLKIDNKYAFLEAKHIKESGGAQDKQIKELIELLNVKVPENVLIISFMDGVYSNKLLDISDENILNPKTILSTGKKRIPKIETQRFEIITNLKRSPQSFWVNTKGLELLFSDFIEKI